MRQKNAVRKVVLLVVLAAALASAATSAWILRSRPGADYEAAMELAAKGQYDAAIGLFASLGEYRDAAELLLEAKYAKGEQALAEGDLDIAQGIFAELGDYGDSREKIAACSFERGARLLADGDAAGALQHFEAAGSYGGSAERILKCRYILAEETLQDGNAKKAAREFAALGSYGDSERRHAECRYQMALETAKQKDCEAAAAAAFRALGNYRDAEERALQMQYAYVRSHFSSTDTLTARYLEELVREDYLDSAELAGELYQWVISLRASLDADDAETDIDEASRVMILWWHFRVENGPLDGLLEVRAEASFPGGQTVREWDGLDSFVVGTGGSYSTSTYYLDPAQGMPGKMTFRIFDENDTLLAEKTVMLT